MFKKFNPKEDVSGSTSLKSSVQRNIRSQLLTQLPYLAQPAYREGVSSTTASSAAAVAAPSTAGAGDGEDEGEDEEDTKGKKKSKGKDRAGGGGGGGGKGKSKKAEKLAKRAQEEDEAEQEAEGGGEGSGSGTVLDDIWPKKEALGLTKCYYIGVQIDRGAIKFLLAGANMMAPGFLSPGGRLPPDLKKDDIVAIQAEGKVHACGIGKMMASSSEIREAGKGVAVEVICWIGDDLWKVDTIGI